MGPAGRVRYRLLGPVELESSDGAVAVDGGRQRLLLAVLLLQLGRSLSTDQLCEVLWEDEQPNHPAAALRSQIARLRRTLADLGSHVRGDANGYRLDVAPDDVDVHRFEELIDTARRSTGETAVALLDAALRLWRGPLTVELCDCPFTQPMIVRLEEMRGAGRERRAELLLALGRAADAVADLRQLVAQCPDRERARALLMEALSLTGRHTEALDQYRSWRADLAESGLEPSPDLRRLEGKILRHTIESAPTRPAPTPRGRIPRPVSSFIGRADELAHLTGRLSAARLVTVTGPGGVGKTRLALAAIAAEGDGARFDFADLSVINDPALVAAAVADAIDLSGAGGQDPHASLIAALADRPIVLVLDNCEHVLEAVSELVDDLLARCSALRVLATSREPLGISGESVVRLNPLTGRDAAALFIERATDGGARLAIERDWPIVDDICARVDRLPLAVELAAKHADHLPLARLLDLLDDRFRLLVDGSPRAAARQRTLDATLRWSYELLDDDEKHLLRHLAVVTGAFTIDAAVFVDALADEITTAQRLGALHRKSLVTFDHLTGRYRLLETVRAFALALLGEHHESDEAHRRLYDWLLDRAPGPWRYPFSPEAIDHADADLDNLRGALRWSADAGRSGAAATLAAAYGPMWFTTVRGDEALRWLVVDPDIDEQLDMDARLAWRTAATYAAFGVLDIGRLRAVDDHLRLSPPHHPAQCPLLFAKAWTSIQTDRPRLRRDLAAVRDAAHGDRCWLANCDLLDGLSWLMDGHVHEAIELLRHAVAHSEELGSANFQLNLAVALHLAGRTHDVAAIVADLDLARRTPTGFWGDLVGTLILVLDAVGRDDMATARSVLGEMLAITARRSAHVKFAYAFAVVAAGIISFTAGRPEDALTIFVGHERHHLHIRYEGGGALANTYQARCLAQVTQPVAERAARRGQNLTLDALLDMIHRIAAD